MQAQCCCNTLLGEPLLNLRCATALGDAGFAAVAVLQTVNAGTLTGRAVNLC